jgi:hypothetical protein
VCRSPPSDGVCFVQSQEVVCGCFRYGIASLAVFWHGRSGYRMLSHGKRLATTEEGKKWGRVSTIDN